MTLPLNPQPESALPGLPGSPLAVTQPVAVQPVPQAMAQAGADLPGHFPVALNHVPVESSLAQRDASAFQTAQEAPAQDAQEAQGPVVFHASPRKADVKAQEATDQSSSQGPASQSMDPAGGARSATTRPPSNGCCDDPATTYILWNDDGSCAAALNACATGVLRSCNALARLPGAVADCLPSSQSLHSGCDRMVSGAAGCCKGFGDCIVDTLGLVKDIICCPFTTCGKLCEECCKGLQNPSCCADDAVCCCCCSDCDCSGCDCDC